MSYYRKPKTPWEIKNAREWAPQTNVQDVPSEDEDDRDFGSGGFNGSLHSSRERRAHDVSPLIVLDDDNEGFQPVIKRFTKIQESKRNAQKPTDAKESTATKLGNVSLRGNTLSTANLKPQSRHDHQAVATRETIAFSKIPKGESYRPLLKPPFMSQQPKPNHQVLVNDPVTVEDRLSPEKDQPIFRFQRDNPARAAFRRREPPSAKFALHKRIIEIESDPNCLEGLLVEFGVRIGSFIRPPQNAQDRELLIWGNSKQVSRTQEELRNWIRQCEGASTGKASCKENFAHEHSTMGVKYRDIQREILKKAETHRFQQIPDAHHVFAYQGAYVWPIEDVIPQDIFGPNLEAFDSMRFSLKSHIVFNDKLQSFRVYTNDDKSVAKALKLIEGTLREFHARNACGGQSSSLLLIDPPERKKSGQSVRMQTWSLSGEPTERRIPLMTGGTLDRKTRVEWGMQSQQIRTSNAIKIQEVLRLALPSVKYRRGQISMKILFGTFVLTRFKWPKEKPASVPFDEFLRNVAVPGTKGQLIRDLRINTDASEILSRLYSLDTALKPLDSTSNSLDEVVQTYGARFEFNRFERPPVQLEIEMHSSAGEKELFEKTHVAWTRLDREDKFVPIDVSVLRLEGGVSWKFQISTEDQLEKWRIDQQLVDFADSVKLKGSKPGAELDGRRLFDWGPASTGCLKPSVFEQKIALRYRLAYDQAFIFEIARYDSYDLSTNAQLPCTTHWGASMWNSDWEVILSGNAGLGLGECADWNPRLQAFFPDPEPSTNTRNEIQEVEPGLKSFLQHIHMVTESLDRIKDIPHLQK